MCSFVRTFIIDVLRKVGKAEHATGLLEPITWASGLVVPMHIKVSIRTQTLLRKYRVGPNTNVSVQ